MPDPQLSGPAGDGRVRVLAEYERGAIRPIPWDEGTVTDAQPGQPQLPSRGCEVEKPAASGWAGPGAFIQVLPGAVDAFCRDRGLDFDERALLEHLVDSAERDTGVISDCTVTGLARALGLGPSGRRTTASRLDRLVAAAAIDWNRGSATEPGRIRILVHPDLVRKGRGDRRVGYVQVCPQALAEVAIGCALSPTARALLRRLVIDVDHRSRTLSVSIRQLTARYGMGRRRMTAALEELADAGLIRRSTGDIHVLVYERVVRTPSPPPPMSTNRAAETPATARLDRATDAPMPSATARPDRAAAAFKTREGRAQNARPTSLIDGRDIDLEPESVLQSRAPSATGQGQVEGPCELQSEQSLLAALALALPVEVHQELLSDPTQGPGRQALQRRIARLAAQVGQDEAIAALAKGWPAQVGSAMALANDRAKRRLNELTTSSQTALAVAELVDAAAARRRTDALVGARNLGRAWAAAGATFDDVAETYTDDPEARQAALAAFCQTATEVGRPDELGDAPDERSAPVRECRPPWPDRPGASTEQYPGSSLTPVGL